MKTLRFTDILSQTPGRLSAAVVQGTDKARKEDDKDFDSTGCFSVVLLLQLLNIIVTIIAKINLHPGN